MNLGSQDLKESSPTDVNPHTENKNDRELQRNSDPVAAQLNNHMGSTEKQLPNRNPKWCSQLEPKFQIRSGIGTQSMGFLFLFCGDFSECPGTKRHLMQIVRTMVFLVSALNSFIVFLPSD